MALSGSAFLPMWPEFDGAIAEEFASWHTYDHIVERLWTLGLNVGRRYHNDDRTRFFVMYEADRFEVFASESYYATGNGPGQDTVRILSQIRSFSRNPCETVISRGQGIGGALATFRIQFLPRNRPVPVPAGVDGPVTCAELLNASARRISDFVLGIDGVTGAHIGMARTVDRRSLRKNSLNNRADLVKFDAVLLVEAFHRNRLDPVLGDIAGIIEKEGFSSSISSDVYLLSSYLAK